MEQMTTQSFTWIPLYQELATKLAGWEKRQDELIAFLETLRQEGSVVTPLQDKDQAGTRFLLEEIDPFTFFGVFNRKIGFDQRLAILVRMKQHFRLKSELPEDFDGVPLLNNLKSWFFPYQDSRNKGDVTRLWRVFRLGLAKAPLGKKPFRRAFDEALTVKQTNVNLTMGLFWIRPYVFLSLDQVNRAYLGLRLPTGGLTVKFYAETLQQLSSGRKSFPEMSLEAWGAENERTRRIAEAKESRYRAWGGINYWLVSAYWDDRDPADQTGRFLEEGIWENGHLNRPINQVMSMRVNDKIAIKATSTQHKDLPFDAREMTVARMTIKAIGTIVANRLDGRVVEVEWDPDFVEKSWYFYTNRSPVWQLRLDDGYPYKVFAEKLRDFVWYGKEQDHVWFAKTWWDSDMPKAAEGDDLQMIKQPYSVQDIIASGVFLTEEDLNQILDRLKAKKALILQGPPGVGKTFIARKLAYALMKEADNDRLEMVQFHQSYSYDDFVRGYRPLPGKGGNFGLQNGVFYDFCQRAIQDPDREYIFIIDEINRGNLSQIFGELLMLIEHDKRGPEFAVPLVYRNENEPRFYIPSNLYLLGLMNVADRSLAMVDYALRRRFAFATLKPQYASDLYRQWLLDRSMNPVLVNLIVERMTALNQDIKEDPLLGENYQIGHSFFSPNGDDFAGLDRNWFHSIVRTEIVPLLKEYWFDNPSQAEEAERKLLA
jgi:5-methylcytosine-specific restriction protein B